MSSFQRVTQVEYQKRLDMLLALRARGLCFSQLVKIACQQWGVSARQAKRYLKKANEQECRLGSQPLEARYAQLLLKFNYIYQQAIQLQNLELARRTALDLAHLLRQQRKEQTYDPGSGIQSGLVESGELEALIRSLEKAEKDEPA